MHRLLNICYFKTVINSLMFYYSVYLLPTIL
jgi:hypothetical protein